MRAPVIQELSSKVPVVTFNTDLPESGRLCYVGPDNYRLRPRERRPDESRCSRETGSVLAGRRSGKQPCRTSQRVDGFQR
ncbi:MAG: hypothetical protein ACLR4Z_00930 [Butyricicoccaceae bacterium]